MLPSGRYTLLLASLSFIIIFVCLHLANGAEKYYVNGASLTADQIYQSNSQDTGKSNMVIFYDGDSATIGYVADGNVLTAKLNQDSLNDGSN